MREGVGLKGKVRRDEKGRGNGGKAMKQWKWRKKEWRRCREKFYGYIL